MEHVSTDQQIITIIRLLQEVSASYDFAYDDSDPSPDPPDDSSSEPNSHGTSCAGEIAMVKNSQCGVGVAYKSNVASQC